MKALLALIPGWGTAASAGLSTLSWIWTHKTLAALIVSCGLLAWYRHEAQSARAASIAAARERDAAAAKLADAEHEARRWHDASDQRDAAIAGLSAALAQQNTAVQAIRASLDRANAAAAFAVAESRAARVQFDQRVHQLEEESRVHPDRIMPLGPIVRDRVERLWD